MLSNDLTFLPPHEPTLISGFHAYGRQLGVAPGEELELCVSNEGPVQFSVLRYLGKLVAAGTEIEALPSVKTTSQPIHRGSYVHIERGLGGLETVGIELWCRPLAAPGGPAVNRSTNRLDCGLFGQHGFQLLFGSDCRPVFVVEGGPSGTGVQASVAGPPLELKLWHHLVAGFDKGRLTLSVDGELVGELEVDLRQIEGEGPLRLGASENQSGEAYGFLTGDLWGPGLYADPLSAEEIAARFRQKADIPGSHCIGYWKFDAIDGAPFRDVSPARRHGRPVNYPIRMIPGPRRTEDGDWGSYDPTKDPDFGSAVRLMADAVVDCRWPIAARWRVPASAPSGQYGIRATNESGEQRYLHFIVRPAQPAARLICLSTTNTRVAYNFQSFNDPHLDYGAYKTHPSYPILGHLLGARRPATGEFWQTTTIQFELPFYAWLEERGIPYDLYTEWDLEADPSLLDHYTAVAFAGHSEYWTPTQYESLQQFNRRGGHLISLSGNTAYWRVSVDRENAVMEVRKHCRLPTPGTTCDSMLHSAHWHQMDHRPGSTMREAGWPEWNLLGGVTNGWTQPPLDGPRFGYEVLAPEHWAFQHSRKVETDFPFAQNAAGYETDLTVRSMFERFGLGTFSVQPPHGEAHEAEPQGDFDAGLTVLARAKLTPSLVLDYDNRHSEGEMWSEMTLHERPDHGLIFCAGSVLSSHVLSTDANFANLLLNVMERMEVPLEGA